MEDVCFAEVDGRSPVQRPVMTPFHALTLPFKPNYILQLAKAYAQNALGSARQNQITLFKHSVGEQVRLQGTRSWGDTEESNPRSHLGIQCATNALCVQRPKLLKVGYLSCDFGDHPVGRLFAFVPQHHGAGVEVTLYALNPSDGSRWRQYVEHTGTY
jgi:predicted O-linked N-acetylglucosamine transferase (SPINDLY family)